MSTKTNTPITSTKEMREFLLTEMKGVADGTVETYRAKGVCNLAQQVYNTLNIEIKHAQAMEKLTKGKITPISL